MTNTKQGRKSWELLTEEQRNKWGIQHSRKMVTTQYPNDIIAISPNLFGFLQAILGHRTMAVYTAIVYLSNNSVCNQYSYEEIATLAGINHSEDPISRSELVDFCLSDLKNLEMIQIGHVRRSDDQPPTIIITGNPFEPDRDVIEELAEGNGFDLKEIERIVEKRNKNKYGN